MANMFEKYAADREAEQKKIEQTVSEPAAAKQTTVSADSVPAEDEKRTTLSLSLTVSDKKALKMMAAERETTIARLSMSGSRNTEKTSKGGGGLWLIYQNTMSRTCS